MEKEFDKSLWRKSMPVSPEFRKYIVEQLSTVVPGLYSRSMFGGEGFYLNGIFFALIADDVLYIYRPKNEGRECESRGLARFHKCYYEITADALENPDALREITQKAVQAKMERSAKKKCEKGT